MLRHMTMWLRRVAVASAVWVAGCGDTEPGFGNLEQYRVGTDGRSLTVIGVHGACDEVLDAEVQESSREVRVTVPLAVDSGGCDDIGLPLSVTVMLDSPLGQRQVVQGDNGRLLAPEP